MFPPLVAIIENGQNQNDQSDLKREIVNNGGEHSKRGFQFRHHQGRNPNCFLAKVTIDEISDNRYFQQ